MFSHTEQGLIAGQNRGNWEIKSKIKTKTSIAELLTAKAKKFKLCHLCCSSYFCAVWGTSWKRLPFSSSVTVFKAFQDKVKFPDR